MSKLRLGKLYAGLSIFCLPTESEKKLKAVRNFAMDSNSPLAWSCICVWPRSNVHCWVIQLWSTDQIPVNEQKTTAWICRQVQAYLWRGHFDLNGWIAGCKKHTRTMWQMNNRENSAHSGESPYRHIRGSTHLFCFATEGFLAAVKLEQGEWSTSRANCRSRSQSSKQVGMLLVCTDKDTGQALEIIN